MHLEDMQLVTNLKYLKKKIQLSNESHVNQVLRTCLMIF